MLYRIFKILIVTSTLAAGVLVRFAFCQTPINCGETKIGAISVAGEKDTYSFTASANDKITIHFAEISGDLYLELYSPTGTKLANIDSGRIDTTLTSDGTYSLVVRGYYSDNIGNYALTLQKLNNPCNATTINCGQMIYSSITSAVPWKYHTFVASANDKVTIHMPQISGDLYLELYAPTGARLNASDSGIIDSTLLIDGVYTLIVSSYDIGDTGNYSLVWQKLNNPCVTTTINCGQIASNSIGAAGEIDFCTFTASANDKITIHFAEISGDLYLELYSPTGTKLANIDSGQMDVTLLITGTYTLIVRGYDPNDIGNYALVWQRLNNPCGAANILFGATTSGEIANPVDIKTYKFSGLANDVVDIRFSRLTNASNDFSPYLELYDSTGTRLAYAHSSAGRLTKKLTADGVYYLLVTDGGSNDTGTYELTLQRDNNPANAKVLNYGAITEDSLESVTGINAYRFTASANDKITICSAVKTQTSGNFDIYLELYDSTGTRLAYGSGSIHYTFTAGGTFYLFITDSYRDGTGTYKFILLNDDISCSKIDIENPQVSLTKPKSGEIIESGSTYTISWTSSDNVGITSQEIRLSTDSGISYPTVIASGLDEDTQSYDWQIPLDFVNAQARIRVTAQDAAGNVGQDENGGDFIIINTTLPTDAKDITYEYDKLSRLTKTTCSTSSLLNYTYDSLGNRLSLRFNNSPPELAPLGNKAINENSLLEFTVSATDVDGDVLSYSASGLPPGATFNSTTQAFRWKPTYAQAGVYPKVHFEVSDGLFKDSEDISITVNNVNRVPRLGQVNPSSGSGRVNQPTFFTTKYIDPDGWQDLHECQLLINNKVSGENCFLGYYEQNTNKLYLRDSQNTRWLGGYRPGVNRIVQNSQAKLDCSQTTVSGSGNSLTIRWAVIFKPTFKGRKNTYLKVTDDADASVGWIKKGTWTVNP